MIKHLFILLFSVLCWGQQLTFVDSTALQADVFVGKDAYRNTYFIKDNVFYKLEGNKEFTFNDYSLGKLTRADIINPLKILLFYQETNTVVFVDNTLNEIERINLNNLPDSVFARSVTNTGNNMIWVYNEIAQQLFLYNYRSKQFVFISPYFDENLIYQTSDFNYCYLLFTDKLIVVNTYGSILFSFPVSGFSKIVLYKQNLIGVKNNKLFYITQEDIQPIKIPIPEITIKDLQLFEEFLYIYDGKKTHTFSIKYPN